MADRLTPQTCLALYLAGVLAISFVHEPWMLGSLLGLALLASGSSAWRLARKTVLAILAFNLTVSFGYVVIASWHGNFLAEYLLRINLRVFLLVFLGFWLVSAIDLLAALSRFPLLRLIATLAIGQMRTFDRLLGDFRTAFESRNPMPPRLLDKTRHAASQARTLLDKSMASATEVALAMRSRGTFDDCPDGGSDEPRR